MIVTLTGPSCAGKTTLESLLQQRDFSNVISTTTRPMRAGEVDGQHYYYVTREVFMAALDAGEYVESVNFNGNHYAVSRVEIERVLRMGQPIVIVVEPHGLTQIREYAKKQKWDIFSVFVDNPTEVLAARFLQRFATEVVLPSKDELTKAVATYASRLTVMIDEERQWPIDAHADDGQIYDAVLGTFDEGNMDAVVAMLVGIGFKNERAAA